MPRPPDAAGARSTAAAASRGEAAVYAAGLALQQPRLLAGADRLVVLSEGHGRLLREHGLDWDRGQRPAELRRRRRLGVRQPGRRGRPCARLRTARAGEGLRRRGPRRAGGRGAARDRRQPVPTRAALRELAAGADVRFAGWLAPDELARERAGAGVVLAPSLCEEACPYAVLDALAAGVPVLVERSGRTAASWSGPTRCCRPATVGLGPRLAALWADRGPRAARRGRARRRASGVRRGGLPRRVARDLGA